MAMSHHLLLLVLSILTSALPFAQQGDGDPEDVPSGGIGYDPSAQGDTNAGSAGTDTGAVSLSKGRYHSHLNRCSRRSDRRQ